MIEAQFSSKFKFLSEPHPSKVLYGGRDGMKSWGIAQQLVIDAAERPLRTLCGRETQKSMKDSVHKLLADTIMRLGVQDRFKVNNDSILGRYAPPSSSPSEFLFAGIKEARNIKSYESCDRFWGEEAQTISKASWEIIIPTIRKQNSEIWVSFNPILSTDDTYQRWVLNPRPGTVVVKVGWEDNPWLSEISRSNIEHLKRTDPEKFEHIYGGECVSGVEGAIFGSEIKKATAEKRICPVPYNRLRPVDTAWDLGFGDMTTIWFVQAYDGYYNFIDYVDGSGLTIADYLIKLQDKSHEHGYVYGTDWVPWDASSVITHKKLSGGSKQMSIEMLMRQAGRRVRIAPQLYIADRINAARTIFSQCRFDEVKCADGLQALRHYQWGPPSKDGVAKREPLHNWASHGSDGFQAAAVAIQQPKAEAKAPAAPPRPPGFGSYTPFG